MMDMKEAVKKAKKHITALYEEEGIAKVGLEQVEFSEIDSASLGVINFSHFRDRML